MQDYSNISAALFHPPQTRFRTSDELSSAFTIVDKRHREIPAVRHKPSG
jgi:hypothetical protein